MPRLLLLLWLALAPLLGFAADYVSLPPLKARVTDLSGTLDSSQQAQLEAGLAALEKEKGAQVVILLLPSTQPETIETFSIRLAEAWKIGRKGVDDGVIILVAKQDRRMRIEVGYGLEGAIPDVVAKRIISEHMAPRFKQGDYFGGLQAAVEQVGHLIGGETLPPPKAPEPQSDPWDQAIPIAMVCIFIVGGILRAVLGRFLGASASGGIAFLGAWLLIGSLLAAAVIALLTFLFTLMGNRGSGLNLPGGGGWSSGSAGVGFSGGGGSFGGGGASGEW